MHLLWRKQILALKGAKATLHPCCCVDAADGMACFLRNRLLYPGTYVVVLKGFHNSSRMRRSHCEEVGMSQCFHETVSGFPSEFSSWVDGVIISKELGCRRQGVPTSYRDKTTVPYGKSFHDSSLPSVRRVLAGGGNMIRPVSPTT